MRFHTAFCLRAVVFLTVMGCCAPLVHGQKSPPRVWRDTTGEFQVTATLEKKGERTVTLGKADGSTIEVPIKKLSAADREFLESLESSSRDRDRMRNRFQAKERELLFAKQILEYYQQELAIDEATNAQRVFIQDRILLLKPQAEKDAVLVKGKFLTPDKIAELRTKSDQLVEECKQLVQASDGVFKSDAFKQAQQKIQEARRLDPVSFRADFYVGLANLIDLGDLKAAEKHFDICVRKGRDYQKLYDEADKASLANALNNLALLKVRRNQINDAERHWREILNITPRLQPEVAHNIQRVVKFIDISEKDPNFSYLQVTRQSKSAFRDWNTQLSGSAAQSQNSSGPGWLYLPYRSNSGSSSGFYRELEDNACLICDGRGDIICTNGKCHGGRIKKYRFVTRTDPSGKFTYTNRVEYYDTCPTCGGDNRVRCRGCRGGKQGF